MLILETLYCVDMGTEDDTVAVEVSLPRSLLEDIDQYAVRHGYRSPSGVVSDALADDE